ncbi:uncharacterized protein LOC119078956 [Bradysia coprophila]|uniref:uncharacterized protein LOC119078956 n=1 Tax=Bradysia coprophila TaxID=38358 RepID=UPI00187D8BE4|nr:uncharacterized protein LOC119078956 [Bradysia coprophila]
MNFTLTLFCISLIIYFTAADDLECYTCFYNEGHPNSEFSCLDDPAPETLKNCTQPVIPGLTYVTIPQVIVTLSERKFCHTYSATLNGKLIVIRGCSLELEKTDKAQINCAYDGIILFDDEIAKNAFACFCSANNCNGPSGEQFITTERFPLPHNAASVYRLRSNVLLTVIIYKFVSYISSGNRSV